MDEAKRKKIVILVFGFLIAVVLVLGLSYAYFSVVKTQGNDNVLGTSCLSVDFIEGNAITVNPAYPITDAEGRKLAPYTFTIKNLCNDLLFYQVNLETLDTSTLSSDYLALALDDGAVTNVVGMTSVTPTLSNASGAKKITTGTIGGGAEVTYDVRLWVAESTPLNSSTQNKVHKSKITIIITPDTSICAKCGVLMEKQLSGGSPNQFLRTDLTHGQIEELEFVATNDVPAHLVAASADVSQANDGSVMAWWEPVGTNSRYKLTIGVDNGVKPYDATSLFNYLENLDKLDLNNFYTYAVTDMTDMFYRTGINSSVFKLDLGDNFNTSRVTTMYNMFAKTGQNCPVFTLNLGDKFDTSNVTIMNNMFDSIGYNNPNFVLNLGNMFDTSNVTQMDDMFDSVGYNSNTKLELKLGSKFDTSKVRSMSRMFENTGYNSATFNLDLGDKFDTSKVRSMSYMFSNTGRNSSGFTLNLRDKFDTSSVTNMSRMFIYVGAGNLNFTLDLGAKFDTSSVTGMDYMFAYAGHASTVFALDFKDKFDTSNVVSMNGMFVQTGYSNPNFTLDLGANFSTASTSNVGVMFSAAGAANPNFSINMKTLEFEKNPFKGGMLQTISSGSTIYVKDAAAVVFVSSGTNLPAGATVVNCAVSACP